MLGLKQQRGLGRDAPEEGRANVAVVAIAGESRLAVVVIAARQLPEFEIDAALGALGAVGNDASQIVLPVTVRNGRNRVVGRAARIVRIDMVGLEPGAKTRGQVEIGQAVDGIVGEVVCGSVGISGQRGTDHDAVGIGALLRFETHRRRQYLARATGRIVGGAVEVVVVLERKPD